MSSFKGNYKISADQVAIAGKRGYLFLYEGFNRYYQMYFDRRSVVQNAIDGWTFHLKSWETFAIQNSNSFHFICLPNKASVHHEFYPFRLGSSQTPYLSVLQKNARIHVFKPKNFEEVFRRNDTHLSPYGNFKFADFILDSLGYSNDFGDLVSTGFQEVIGDLGSKFDPPISEQVEFLKHSNSSAMPQVVLDNSSEYLPDRHIGITIQFENHSAPHEKSLRIFGNSFLGNSSVYSTLWLLSLVFQKVSFHWSPVVLPDTIEEGEIVIFQTCERFLGYSPDHWK
jgi:hypothetical protein